MLEKIRSYLLMISFLVIAGGLMLYMYVLAKGDSGILGGKEGTLQPTDFASLSYSVGDTGYLMCSTPLCSVADPDANEELFNLDAGRLRQLVADYADSLPTVTVHSFDFRLSQFDFIERMPGKTFPTVISVRIIRDTDYSSKLAFYSYKPVGSSTANDHQQNAARWITDLHARADDQ